MGNQIVVSSPIVNGNNVQFPYRIIGEWEYVFDKNENMYVEYSCDVSSVPKSVLIIPLISNLLPVSWMLNGEIIVDELDKDFYECIDNIKNGYRQMFPQVEFKGSIKVRNVCSNSCLGEKKMMMFSGGVDAFATLTTHANENPDLFTVWGADVAIEDVDGWNKILSHAKHTSELFKVDYFFVKSNFRKFIRESVMHNICLDRAKDGWWHGFQHMLGLVGLASPICYLNRCNKLYLASSYCAAEKGTYTSASDPTIDNFVEFSGTKLFHDGYEFNRQEKVNRIVEYSKTNDLIFPIHVCWETQGGINCCWCEKCMRTIMEILSKGGDPAKFGFRYENSKKEMQHLRRLMPEISERRFLYFYRDSQKELKKTYSNDNCPKEMKWFYNVDFDSKSFQIECEVRGLYHKLKRRFIG